MKRKPSLIPGLDRILSAREASVLLAIPEDKLLNFYQGQREISLRRCSSWRGTASITGVSVSIISTLRLKSTTHGGKNPSCGRNGFRSFRSPAYMG